MTHAATQQQQQQQQQQRNVLSAIRPPRLLMPTPTSLVWSLPDQSEQQPAIATDGLTIAAEQHGATARLRPIPLEESYERAYPFTVNYQYLGPSEAPRPFRVVVTRSRYAAHKLLGDRYSSWTPKEDSLRTPVLVDLEWRSSSESTDAPLVQLFLPDHHLMLILQPSCFDLIRDGISPERHDSQTTVQFHLRKLFEDVGRYNFYTFAGYNDVKVLRRAFEWKSGEAVGLSEACFDLKLLYEQGLPRSELGVAGARSLLGMARRLGPVDETAPTFDKSRMGQPHTPLDLRAVPLNERLVHRLCADMHCLRMLHDHLVGGLRRTIAVKVAASGV